VASKGTFLPTIAFAVALIVIMFAPLRAQTLNARSPSTQSASAPTPDWEIAAGGKMAFDTVTVRQNTTAPPNAPRSATFPLGPGDVYISRGGFFGARNFPLYLYIFFAYKVTDNQEQFLDEQLPKWAFTDRFDIEARKEGNPTKDQMRLMMRSLLADRFRLAAHHEIRQLPVYALLVDQPGKLGRCCRNIPMTCPVQIRRCRPALRRLAHLRYLMPGFHLLAAGLWTWRRACLAAYGPALAKSRWDSLPTH
jgi:hypothetical protein